MEPVELQVRPTQRALLLGFLQTSYFLLSLIHIYSWTIAADGRQFQALDTDFKDVGAYGDQDMQATDRFRIVTPPASDPGAVVTCETQVHLRPYMNSEDWEMQAPIPVVDEALELALPPSGH